MYKHTHTHTHSYSQTIATMSGHCVCVYYQAVRSSNKMQHVTIEGEMWRVLFHVVQLPVTYVSAKQTHIHRELHNVYANVLLHTVRS